MKIRIKDILVGVGGLLLLVACEKDGPEAGMEKVEVVLSVNSAGYGASDEILRSIKNIKPETVIVPLDGDIYLSASLIPDTVGEATFDDGSLRAAVTLDDKQKIKLAAFNGTTQVTGSPVTYTYSTGTGKFTPDLGVPLGVEPGSTNYRFVAYSYYGAKTTAPAETGITWDKDLVWGYQDKQIPSTYTGREVNITMAHKFSRVRVQIKSGEIATAMKNITNVQIVGGKTASFSSVRNGDLAEGSAVAQTVTGFSGTGTTQQSSQYLFYKSPTQVTIGSLTLTIGGADRVFSNITANFTEELAGGVNYVLVVDVKGNRWSHSNIYWDRSLNSGTGGLTFDKTATGAHSDYQGVLFQWGSLIGISPVGSGETSTSTITIYVPPVGGGNWDASHTVYHSSSLFNFGSSGWNGIPRLGDEPTTSNSAENYLYTHNNFAKYQGDVCNYLDNAWRLPNGEEFKTVKVVTAAATGSDPNDAAGKGSVPYATCTSTLGPVLLPMSGRRNYTLAEATYGAGIASVYWCGSTGSGAYAWTASFASTNIGVSVVGTSFYHNYGLSVRCIKKLPTD
jgi:hypothetical protein